MTRPVVGPRTTGATDAQIDNAMRRGIDKPGVDVDLIRGLARISIDKAAALLVPPDHRIVAVADLERLSEGYKSWSNIHWATDERDQFIAQIDALIGGER